MEIVFLFVSFYFSSYIKMVPFLLNHNMVKQVKSH